MKAAQMVNERIALFSSPEKEKWISLNERRLQLCRNILPVATREIPATIVSMSWTKVR